MAIILDGSLGIQRDEEQQIANIEWFLYGLPDTEAAPEDVVFLNESFGTDSPQMVSFTLEGEEYAVYADWQSVAGRPPVAGFPASSFAELRGAAQPPQAVPSWELPEWFRQWGQGFRMNRRHNRPGTGQEHPALLTEIVFFCYGP